MNKHRPTRRAFTLLELLVAMTMVVVLSASLYASLNIAFRSKRRAEATVTPIRAAGAALDIIARDLGSVMIPHELSNSAEVTAWYVAGAFIALNEPNGNGSAGWMEFSAVGSDGTPDVPLSEGVRRNSIGLRNDVDPPALVRRVTRNVLTDTELYPEEDELLCNNVRSFSLLFHDGLSVYEDWDSTLLEGALPILVEVELVLNVPGATTALGEVDTYRIRRMMPLAVAKPIDLETLANPVVQ